jgi:Putative zinc-finger
VSWHADPAVLTRYAEGSLDDARAYSLEAHLLACERCRAVVPAASFGSALDTVWARIDATISAPPARRVERILTACGVPDHVARLLAATPSLRLSWFGAVAATLAFAAVAARAGRQGVLAFLIVAPLVPLAGVAAAFGPGVDPAYEVALAAPVRGSRLLLVRALAVLAASLLLIGTAALALPEAWTSAAWLLPSLGLAVASLACSTLWSPMASMAGVASAWVIGVLVAETGSHVPFAAFHASGQWACLAVAVLSLGVVFIRREAFERRTGP